MSWGILLHGVSRQQKHHSQYDKQGESESHDLPLFLDLRRASAGFKRKKGNRWVQASLSFYKFQLSFRLSSFPKKLKKLKKVFHYVHHVHDVHDKRSFNVL